MRSEFILAFNEICEERGLAKDVVFEALKTALVSAYKRNVNINVQDVRVEIDQRTGEPTIYAEKEVVDSVIDDRTEVLLEEAHRQGFTDAQYGDMVMVSTPRNFAASLRRRPNRSSCSGCVKPSASSFSTSLSIVRARSSTARSESVGGQHITIGLDRTEAIMPRNQQVRVERYRPHDKIRVYLLEVRRTNRGPQIIVSRNHRNLLRRPLELEVPEIYNGQVDIKSIAREAGARSKVAVMARQEGVDRLAPAWACAACASEHRPRAERRRSTSSSGIPIRTSSIAKALSPARVSQVHLDDHPDEGKTAVVIVPDDQLSLAIGKEGQNARLAAKLTGWRIDIQSLTESAAEGLTKLDHPAVDARIARDDELLEKVRHVLAKKEADRPVTAEDYMVLDRFVAGTLGRIIDSRTATRRIRRERAEARKRVPAVTWEMELEELNLPLQTHNLLLDNEITTVGEVLYRLELGDDHLLRIDGFNDRSLEAVHNRVAELKEALAAGAEAQATELEATGAEEMEPGIEVVEAEQSQNRKLWPTMCWMRMRKRQSS